MKKYNFSVQARQETGKHVEALREQGLVPGVVYGGELKTNFNVKMKQLDIQRLYKNAGYSSLVTLEIEGQNEPMEAMIKDVSFDPLLAKINHVDFYKIRAGQKIETAIPIDFIGESPAVKDLGGTLVETLSEIKVRCLAKDLMEHIEVNVSALKTFEDSICVRDLKLPEGVEIMEDLASPIVNVVPPHVEEVEAVAPEAAMPEVAGEKKEGAAAEGDAKNAAKDAGKPEKKDNAKK